MKESLNHDFNRIFMNFFKEMRYPPPQEEPLLVFSQDDSDRSTIGNVVLLKGDYITRLKETDSGPDDAIIDYLDMPISVEADIIPRGTVIAYVGGGACPPGYIESPGVGRIDEHSLVDANALRTDIEGSWYGGVQIDRSRGQDKPRTILTVRGLNDRPAIGPPAPYQVISREVTVDPI